MSARLLSCSVLVLLSATMTGCMPKMTLEEMRAMRPQRTDELARLDAFAGRWEFTGEAKMAGLDEPLPASGVSEGNWSGDGWYMVADGVFHIEGLGEMKGHEVWTYDAKSKVYRSSWADSMGGYGTGTGRFNERTGNWTMRFNSHTPHGKSKGKGTVRFIDDNTMEFDMTEYAMGGLVKVFEMKGTSRRTR